LCGTMLSLGPAVREVHVVVGKFQGAPFLSSLVECSKLEVLALSW
jgi:hypothetical protein